MNSQINENEGFIHCCNDLRDKISKFFKDSKIINDSINENAKIFEYIINKSQPIPKPISEKLINNCFNLKTNINTHDKNLKNFFEDAKNVFKNIKEHNNKQKIYCNSDIGFRLNESNNLKLENAELKKKINDAQAKIVYYEKKIKNFEIKLAENNNSKAQKENNNKEKIENFDNNSFLTEYINNLKQDLATKDTLLIKLKIEIFDLNEKLKKLNEISNSNINNNYENYESSLKEECKSLKNKISLQNEEIDELKKELTQFKDSMEIINDPESASEKYKREIKSLKQQIQILKEALDFQKKNENIITLYLEKDKNNEVKNYENEIKSLKKEIENLNNTINELKNNQQENIKSSINSINNLGNSKINNININNMNNNDDYLRLVSKLKQLEKDIEKLRKCYFENNSKDNIIENNRFQDNNIDSFFYKILEHIKRMYSKYNSFKEVVKNFIEKAQFNPQNKNYYTEICKYIY